MTPVQRVLRIILIVQTARPSLVLLVALALSALSILYTIRNLGFWTTQRDLLSPKDRLVQLAGVLDQFDDLNTFVVVIENRDTTQTLEFLDALVPHLEADEENYTDVFYRFDPKPFRPWALLYLDKEDLLTLHHKLLEHQDFIRNLAKSPGLSGLLREINSEMASAMVGELFTGYLEGGDNEPLDLSFLIRILSEMRNWLDGATSFTSPWESFFTDVTWDDYAGEGYFWTENKRYLLLFITPRPSDEGFVSLLKPLNALRHTISEVQKAFPDIEAGVTGGAALGEDELGVAFHDMSLATLISLSGLTVLLALFWRGIRRPLLEMIELVVALSLTFGLTTFFIGHLNILSVTFAPLLLGLGIDYGIHWFARYQEEEQLRGKSKREAVEATMIGLGPGILLAGFTAALSFFPLVLTGFRGLVELGIITSMGMVMTTITTLCLLPALTLMFDKPGRKARSGVSFGHSRYLLKLNNRRAFAILIPAAIGLGLSLWGAREVAFDLNMLRLQSRSAESVVWERKLLEGSEHSSMFGAVFAHSMEEVREKTAALEALPTVSEVTSINSLLPQAQEEKIHFLRQMKPILDGVGALHNPVDSIDLSEVDENLGRIRFKMVDSDGADWGLNKPLEAQMSQVRGLIDLIRDRFDAMGQPQASEALQPFEHALVEDLDDKIDLLRANSNTSPMGLDDLPEPLLRRFVGEGNLYLIRVFPAEDIWEPALLGAFVSELTAVDPEAIGDPVTLYTFTKAFRDACISAALYAMVFIFLLLFVTYRNLFDTFMMMSPLVVGTVWTLGLMRIFHVNFNLANSLFLPLIVGAGVEYGIMIVLRWWQGGGNHGSLVLPFSTAKGVILAGLTTTVGFGSLTISDHQGIHSLGLLAMIGSLSILAAAIFFLPSMLQLLGYEATRKKGLPPRH